jgi:hypothetical protein
MMSILRCSLPLILTVVMGCGDHKPTLPTAVVTGTVTYQGKPLSAGRIAFFHPSGQAVGADLGADGAFKMTAFQGKNQVAVECFEQPNSNLKALPHTMMARKSLIPGRYAEFSTSGLTFEVKPGENKAQFALTD